MLSSFVLISSHWLCGNDVKDILAFHSKQVNKLTQWPMDFNFFKMLCRILYKCYIKCYTEGQRADFQSVKLGDATSLEEAIERCRESTVPLNELILSAYNLINTCWLLRAMLIEIVWIWKSQEWFSSTFSQKAKSFRVSLLTTVQAMAGRQIATEPTFGGSTIWNKSLPEEEALADALL